MKKLNLNNVGLRSFGVMKKAMLFMVSVSLLFAACKKGAENEIAAEANGAGKEGAEVSATGRPIITVFPLRAAHNTGYDSASECAPSSWNCGSTYSNSDWFISSSDAHYGIDFWAASGAPLVAPVTGVLIKKDSNSGYGNRVCIRDANGWYHWLIHMNHIASGLPAVGSTVQAGTPIGGVGATGGANGVVHLHYSVTPVSDGTSGYWSQGINFYAELKPTEVNVCAPPTPPTPPRAGSFEPFTTGVGRFTTQPTATATTVGIATTSTLTWVQAHPVYDIRVTMNDNTSVTTPWKVRLISGSGVPANNVALPKTGKVFFWAITSTAQPGATVRLFLDDSDGTEQSTAKPIVSGVWTKYEWDLATFSGSQAFPTLPTNGILDATNVTLDAIVFEQPNTATSCSLYIDDVGK